MDEALRTGIYPRGMTRQVSRLSGFTKPTALTEQVKVQLAQNTCSWMANNLYFLHDHYETVIQVLNNVKKNKVSLDIAKGCAVKRYGARLRASTLTVVEYLLVSGEGKG